MARATHYETLGLRPTATDKEVKAAYRRIVLRHHPDRSDNPSSTRIFIEATTAYEALSDPQVRADYDRGLENETRRKAEREAEERREREANARVRAARAASTAPPKAASVPTGTPLPTQLSRLSMLYSRGLYAEAERLADEIVQIDPRQSLPYAVKGDLARGRGKLDEAARQYSLAIQMDPRNATYLRRYEEVLQRVRTSEDTRGGARIEPNERIVLASLALGVIALLAALFVVVSPERPALQGFGPFASWTIGLLSMLFVGGVATGVCLSVGNALDRLDSYASGHVAPTVALGIVSLASFPLAALLYLILGVAQRGFNASTTRLMVGVAVVVATLAVGAGLSGAHIDPISVLVWGGNLAYLGALCGWAVTDGLKGG